MKISELYPSKYVKAQDLNGKTVTLTMAKLVIEELGHGTEKERKPVLYFQKATKGMILNATNARTIAALHGDDSIAWEGKRISIYPTTVRAFGKVNDVIRVVEQIPPAPKPAGSPLGAQAAPLVEENEIDDQEDFTDSDEGNLNVTIDPETGEIIDGDALFTKDEPAGKQPDTISQPQLTRLNIVGQDLHGKQQWDAIRPKLVSEVSNGAYTSATKLTRGEAQVLIATLEKELKHARTNGKVHA